MVKKRKSKKIKGIFYPIIVMIILTITIIYTDTYLRPTVITMTQYKMQDLITKAINDAVMSVTKHIAYRYNDLVQIHKNANDEIVSISYDAIRINKLKSEIMYAVREHTQKIPDTYIYIPIGNMFGVDILQNKGPKLKFKIKPSSYTSADIHSVFRNTGINQINHQIFITINVTANALIPNYSTSITTQSNICIAETIIIGKVPSELGSDIIDYH